MIDKKNYAEEQAQRMRALMNYGLNESKQPAYSTVEYGKEAADGKLYGIVREGSRYYIKAAKNPKGGLVAENFDYIGGFRNRKENEFESFASAQRFFCEKLSCINESVDDKQKKVIAESWDINEKKEVVEEGTKKMQAEIARQRQIMKNAQNIMEGKTQTCDMEGCPKCDTIKTEEPESKPGAPFTQKITNADLASNEKKNIKGSKKPMVGNKKATNESTETPLTSRENPDYMDTSHGTEIGNNAPFVNKVKDKVKDAVAMEDGGEAESEPELNNVNEEVSLHSTDNQNSPAPGVGEKGDNAPYEETVTEDVEDLSDELEDDKDIEDLDIDNDGDDDEIEAVEDEEVIDEPVDDDVDDEDIEADVELELDGDTEDGADVETRLSNLEDKLDRILDAIGDMKYDDDEELYDDDEDDLDNDEEDEVEDEEEFEVVESRSFKAMKNRMLREENDFGKHPAFQKRVMTTPPTNMPEKEGQYDMNDDSVKQDKPYATEKGSNAPFEIDPEQIENAITEAVMKILKKK